MNQISPLLYKKFYKICKDGLFNFLSWTVFFFLFVCKGRHAQKKCFFLVVGPLRMYPLYTYGLVVHATFFSLFCSLIMAWNGFWQFFLFLPNFWKNAVFCLLVKGVSLTTPLMVRPLKKNLFLFVCKGSREALHTKLLLRMHWI